MFSSSVNSRVLSCESNVCDDQVFAPQKNYLFDLSYLSLLRVDGSRAKEFLQGQLTCDLRDINSKHMRQGALCDLKGRVLTVMDVVEWENQGLYLILPDDLLEETQKALAKPAMFSKVSLQKEDSHRLLGFYLQNPSDTLPIGITLPSQAHTATHSHNYCCYALSAQDYVIILPSQQHHLIQPFLEKNQWRGSLAWHALQLEQKQMSIYPESRGLFLPHRLELHQSGHINFNKGCYKGQEIIARVHYRSKPKHKLHLLTITTEQSLRSGDVLLSEEKQEIGLIIDYSPIRDNTYRVLISQALD